MRRTLTLAALACLALGAISLSLTKDGWTQLGYLAGIRLQTSTPGTADVGHGNITGTMRAGQFVGGGSGLVGIPWASLVGVPSFTILQPDVNQPFQTGNILINGQIRTQGSTESNGSFAAGAMLRGLNTATTGVAPGVFGRSASTTGIGVRGQTTATTGLSYGGLFESASSAGVGVLGRVTSLSDGGGGSSYGGYFDNSASGGIGVFGGATSTLGTTYGGYFESASSSGSGVFGLGATTGVYGESTGNFGQGGKFQSGTNGIGVWGLGGLHGVSGEGSSAGVYGSSANIGILADATGTSGAGVYATSAGTYGVRGISTRSSGFSYGGHFEGNHTGVEGVVNKTDGQTFGGRFTTDSYNGYGVFGYAGHDTGPTYGGHFWVQSSAGIAVYGLAGNNSGTNYGGYFQSDGDSGRGVYGYAVLSTGQNYGVYGRTNSESGRGVYGAAEYTNTGTNYGVLGSCVSTNGYAVYGLGDSGASGTKSFRIDHPFDPENKYLLHYAAESPFPQNFYSGNVLTDDRGYAWVELPEYFAEINANFKYQLTVVDDEDSEAFIQAKISKKIRGTRFQIRTSAPNVEVSWRVEADRNDLRVRFNRPTDERQKTGPEKGKYQHPELYGMPKEMGMVILPKALAAPGQTGRQKSW